MSRARDFKPNDSFTGADATPDHDIPLRMKADYVMSPFAEIASHTRRCSVRAGRQGGQGPAGHVASAASRTASVSAPLTLPLWLSDDMKFTSGTSAPRQQTAPRRRSVDQVSRPGAVTFDKARPELEKLPTGLGFNARAP